MTDINTTQATVSVLDKIEVDISLTQASISVLSKNSYPLRTTQASVSVLDNTVSEQRVSSIQIQCLVTNTPCITHRAQVWKITRRDGITFAFTTHDEPVTFMNITYKPCESLRASASDSGVISTGGVGDTTVNGLISDESISDFDLANGLFDGATIEVWVVSWSDSEFKSDSPQRIAAGVLGQTSQGDITYIAEMLSPGSKLATKPLLDTFTPACRWKLGDGICPVDLASLTESSSVESVATKNAFTQSNKRQFFDSSLSGDNGYYDFGTVTWTTGNNTGLSSEIKTYLDDVITLWKLMPYDILPGDSYNITPGCRHDVDDHTIKFGLDMVDFGGFPDIPGFDELIKTPNAKG